MDAAPWSGTRPFRVAAKTRECADTASLDLVPSDGGQIPPGLPGQYLTLEVAVPGQPQPQVRCYSLSQAPRPDGYRITVKAVRAKPGAPPPRVSPHLVERVAVGDVLQVRAPLGRFVLEPGADPVVLVGGGIGVTPLLSMLEAAVATGPQRDVWVFLSFRRAAEHPFAAHLRRLASAERVSLHVSYSRPGPDDTGHDRAGRIDGELLAARLPRADRPYAFYLCGPPSFLTSLRADLAALGVPDSRVHVESFGPASARRITRSLGRPGAKVSVEFARAGKRVPWDPSHANLLDFALDQGVFLPFACATGRCGTCATELLDGQVDYPLAPEFPVREGRCLPCVAVPRTDVRLDL